MADNTTPNAAIKAGEEFLVEARDSLNSLLRQLRRSGGEAADRVSSELASFLDEARSEGARVVDGLRGVTTTTASAAKKSAGKKSAAKKSTGKKSTAKKSTGKKSAAKKSTGKKSAAKKSTGKKSAAKKSTAKKKA